MERRRGKWEIGEKEMEVTVRDWREGKGSGSEGLKRRKGKWQWGIEEKEREVTVRDWREGEGNVVIYCGRERNKRGWREGGGVTRDS